MKKRKWLAVIAGMAALLILWLLWGNQALTMETVTVADPELPEAFRGFRIAQVSDLHNAEFGAGNRQLLALLEDAQPDIIVITGDLIDSRNTDLQTALEFVRGAVRIAPCYFVTGNHESRVESYPWLEERMISAGVTVLRGAAAEVERDGETIRVIGAEDYCFFDFPLGEDCVAAMMEGIVPFFQEGYNLLLCHRPEPITRFAGMDVDLVLSGHAHGGQIRIPFVGGLYAPDQGFFPEYDEGLYRVGEQFLVVSRGLGNSLFPLRVNNRPQLVLITLERPE